MGNDFQKETSITARLIINRNGVAELTLNVDCSLTVAYLRSILTERLSDISENEQFIHSNGAPIHVLDEKETIISELLLENSEVVFLKTKQMKEMSQNNETYNTASLQQTVRQEQQQTSPKSSTLLPLVPVIDTVTMKTESGTKPVPLSEILSSTSLKIENETCSITDMKRIVSALKKNKTVKELALVSTCRYVIEILAEVLKVNRTLTGLDITYEMNDADCILIANALTVNRSVRDLKLSRNEITSKGCQAIAEILKSNKTIKYLEICRNNLRDEGVKFICEALMINKTLRQLDISQIQISISGCALVAQFLRINQTLTLIDIGDNDLGDDGIIMIADALKYNNTLRELYSKSNKITTRGALALVDTLKTNRRLTTVKLHFNSMSREEAVEINKKAPQLKTTGYDICHIF